MRLLALDAALRQCSAALLDGEAVLGASVGGDSRQAAASLSGLVEALLARHGRHLDAIGVTTGPGSFTGLRAALAFAHGMALGASIPLVGVTVAEALRGAAYGDWVAIDSRREGRIFLGGGDGAVDVMLDALPCHGGPVRGVGDAAGPVVAALRRAGYQAMDGGGDAVDPGAVGRVALRRLRGGLPPCDPQPLYAEPPEARPPGAWRPAPA